MPRPPSSRILRILRRGIYAASIASLLACESVPAGLGIDAARGSDSGATSDGSATLDAESSEDATSGDTATDPVAPPVDATVTTMPDGGGVAPDPDAGGMMMPLDGGAMPRPDGGGMMMPLDGGAMPRPDGGGMMMPPDGGAMPRPDGGGMMMPPDGGSMPRPDGGGMMMPPDGGSMPRPDGGGMAVGDGGSSSGGDSGGCTFGGTPPTGSGLAEDRVGSTRWTDYHSAQLTAISGGTAIVGNQGLSGSIPGFVDVFVWDDCDSAWELEATLSPPGAMAENDFFGSAVAIDGDLIAVGAAMHDLGGGSSGGAYVFRRSGTTWTRDPSIPIATGVGARFGRALGISSSRRTLVVGAPLGKHPSSTTTYTGAIAVLTRGTTGPWSNQAVLVPSELVRDDAFGFSVAFDGDTIVSGAPGSFAWGSMTGVPGKAFVYSGAGSTWTMDAYLRASDGANDDWFGHSVDHLGDVVVVGAPMHDGGGVTDSGAAYVFTRTAGTWTETAKLSALDPAIDAYFGFSVAVVSGTRILVGARGTGRIHSFTRTGGTWIEDAAQYSSCSGTVGHTLDVSGNLAISAIPGGTIFDLEDPSSVCVGP